MPERTDAVLLRIFIGEEDEYEGRPLYEALVEMAHRHRLAGATVVRGPGGWVVRTGEAIVGLAALYGIWLFLAFGLASFVTKF